ncbi:MAG: hypothetical protein A2Z71_06980 [Chloroflexi bacterium RBG_13_50_21]|nr:MAG: hypothetical protein A2Z71_06980 [Chloroflexi bacterium RBG_13_50_21]
MADKSRSKKISDPYPGLADSAVSQLRQEYLEFQDLFQVQPPLVQRFLETQASSVAEAVLQGLPQVRFTLPDRVVLSTQDGEGKPVSVPSESREQITGGLMDRLMRTDLRTALRLRLGELEQSSNRAVSVSAGLLRHAVVSHMVHNMLPSGRTVEYKVAEGEEIPSIPVQSDLEPESAITATTDAIVMEEGGEAGRGELLVPYVEAARRFYLPQWVAFDDEGHLLVGGVNEAEANIASMQRYLTVLHAAVGMAPYMVADEEYQRKRYGILGQLVNQGRALARYQVKEIIRTIQRRASSHDLNRGLSLSLPYFNDQTLAMENYGFEVIPAGRIMFVPAFVVRAAREQEAKIAQDTRLNQSTRKHLLAELATLEKAFIK